MERISYIISDDTMFIEANDSQGIITSRIYETEGKVIDCALYPNKVIERNCKFHAQSYSSRKDLTKQLTNVNSKTPIIVDLFGSYLFFCTHSDRVYHNSWINLQHVSTYQGSNGSTRVLFHNNEEITIDISMHSFNKQYLNALKLHYAFTLQVREFNKRTYSATSDSNIPNAKFHDPNGEKYVSYLNYLQNISGES